MAHTFVSVLQDSLARVGRVQVTNFIINVLKRRLKKTIFIWQWRQFLIQKSENQLSLKE